MKYSIKAKRKSASTPQLHASCTAKKKCFAEPVQKKSDRDIFLAAHVSPKVDFITMHEPRSEVTKAISRQRINNHKGGSTIHDPTPEEIAILANQRLQRLEISLDLLPSRDTRRDQMEASRRAIYRILTKRSWPFSDGTGVRKTFRASKMRGVGHTPQQYVGDSDDVELRAPHWSETFYMGDRYDFKHYNAAQQEHSFAQLRIYLKRTDQNQQLPEDQWRVRIEVTIWGRGLDIIGVRNVGDLIGGSYRKWLSKYFFLLDPDTLWLPNPGFWTAHRFERLGRVLHGIIRHTVEDVGCFTLLKYQRTLPGDKRLKQSAWSYRHRPKALRILPTRTHADAAANKKLADALDNLTRRMRPPMLC